MIAQVTDCADSIGAVRMRSPLSRRSSWKVLTTPAMLPRPVCLARDESHCLPVLVDSRALVVDAVSKSRSVSSFDAFFGYATHGAGLRAELLRQLNQGAG